MFRVGRRHRLCAFTTDTAGELDVLGHNSDSLGMDGAEIGVFENANQVGFRPFLNTLVEMVAN